MKYIIDEYLKKELDKIKKLSSKNWDNVMIIDGQTEMGMSTIAIQTANYMLKGLKMKQIKFEEKE